ncbi:MAG: ester cyclase [Candidatus Hodarchaeota archaeon]
MEIKEKCNVVKLIFTEGWNQEIFNSFSAFLADSFVLHHWNKKIKTNRNALRRIIRTWRDAFPDLYFEIVSITGSEDMVAANLVLHGTHTGTWKGIRPTRKKISVDHKFFFQFQNDKIEKIWEVNDEYGMRLQLAAVLKD